MESTPESTFTVVAKITKELTSSAQAKTIASLALTSPVTSGLDSVRFISASMSLSYTMFPTLAPAADSVPATKVQRTSSGEGTVFAATNITGKVVMSRSSMIRSFISTTNARSRRKNRESPGTTAGPTPTTLAIVEEYLPVPGRARPTGTAQLGFFRLSQRCSRHERRSIPRRDSWVRNRYRLEISGTEGLICRVRHDDLACTRDAGDGRRSEVPHSVPDPRLYYRDVADHLGVRRGPPPAFGWSAGRRERCRDDPRVLVPRLPRRVVPNSSAAFDPEVADVSRPTGGNGAVLRVHRRTEVDQAIQPSRADGRSRWRCGDRPAARAQDRRGPQAMVLPASRPAPSRGARRRSGLCGCRMVAGDSGARWQWAQLVLLRGVAGVRDPGDRRMVAAHP